jgi:hypothetical protein
MKECARVTRRLNRGSGQSNISVIGLLHDGFPFIRFPKTLTFRRVPSSSPSCDYRLESWGFKANASVSFSARADNFVIVIFFGLAAKSGMRTFFLDSVRFRNQPRHDLSMHRDLDLSPFLNPSQKDC